MEHNNGHTIAPVFIFSLPRSGSTLLQRILSCKAEIVTTSEPWIALPLVYLLKPTGMVAEYSHKVAQIGISDFVNKFQHGRDSYYKEAGNFIRKLYSQIPVSQNAMYFLDKTPRYYLIIDELMKMFPDGRFIFLWRNPLSVASSISNSWDKGRWNISQYSLDLYEGLPKLITSYEKYKENSIAISYEDLVMNKEEVCKYIYSYLGLSNDNEKVEWSNNVVKGRLGDKTGIASYSKVDLRPISKWKKWVCNPIRKKWCLGYLEFLGEEKLHIMGYSLNELKENLAHIPVQFDHIPSDLIRIITGAARRKVMNVIWNKNE